MNSLDIKKYRKEMKLTQEELAKKLGITKRTIINYEKGEIIPESKVKLFQHLMSESISQLHEEAIQVNYSEMNVMFVPLVSSYAYAGFLNGFGDEEYIDELPKVSWADDKEHRGDYLCFEVKGDSMEDGTSESILEGDILLCRNVRQEFWKSKLHINKWDFVIVHKEDGILVKRIIKHDVETGDLVLHSLNDYYEDKTINLKDVAKILNVVDIKRKHKRR